MVHWHIVKQACNKMRCKIDKYSMDQSSSLIVLREWMIKYTYKKFSVALNMFFELDKRCLVPSNNAIPSICLINELKVSDTQNMYTCSTRDHTRKYLIPARPDPCVEKIARTLPVGSGRVGLQYSNSSTWQVSAERLVVVELVNNFNFR